MEEIRRSHEKSFKSLIDLGTKGFFPLFYDTWLHDAKSSETKTLSSHEKRKAKVIMQKLHKHKSIERKKTLLLSLTSQERNYFIKAFLKLVEGKILDEKPELH
ncbi:MAG: hypothetical protein HN576_03605 [Bacteriovoracaceae bacterium]|nr:hypothetical protein [Bacteriovoracaceae bacterium]